MSKLSPEKRIAIVEEYQAGQSSRALADKYGVHSGFVRTLFQRSQGYQPFNRMRHVSEKRQRLIKIMAECQNLTARELAERAGVTVNHANTTAKQTGYPLKRVNSGRQPGYNVVLPQEVVEALFDHATKRSITVRELVVQIVSTAAASNLVDAVLDDMPEAA